MAYQDTPDIMLDITDDEIVNILSTLNLVVPPYLEITPSTQASLPLSDSIPLSKLMNSIMTYIPDDPSSDSEEEDKDVFFRIQEVLRWCLSWWSERQQQVSERSSDLTTHDANAATPLE